jgi:hypothetical protein
MFYSSLSFLHRGNEGYIINMNRVLKSKKTTVLTLTSLTDWLGRYARFVDHLAVRDAAEGAPLGGGSTLQNFDCALDTTAWVQIYTALESAPTPTACYAASTNPRTETIYDNVLHYLIGQNVGDTGRPG